MDSTLYASLQAAKTRWIRILWCDNANIIRGKAFHLNVLDDHRDYGIGIAMAQQAVPAMYDAVAPNSGLTPVGEVWLVPDWASLRLLPYAPGHARVMGDMVDQGQPWSCCPRLFLKRCLAEAERLGFTVMAAFENEFSLLQMGQEYPVPADSTVFASTLAMDLGQAVIDEISEALILQEIQVERYYPESGPGQHEISVRYAPAVQAADQQIAFRETVHAIARRHQIQASFLPKIYADKAGNGCHLHLSLWQDGRNLLPTATGELSPLGQAFVAGILAHLPALMALTTPSPNSYRRIQPHCWSGAFCAWGYDNREAAIRIPSNPVRPSPTHIEVKTVDASANPYLALGAVIMAGLDGIRRDLRPGEPAAVDPGHWSDAERQQRGVTRLPTQLGDAIAQLEADHLLLTALGDDLARAFLAVRLAEWNAMKDLTLNEEVQLLLERY